MYVCMYVYIYIYIYIHTHNDTTPDIGLQTQPARAPLARRGCSSTAVCIIDRLM